MVQFVRSQRFFLAVSPGFVFGRSHHDDSLGAQNDHSLSRPGEKLLIRITGRAERFIQSPSRQEAFGGGANPVPQFFDQTGFSASSN